jgi:prepilin-type N-terminal cleavage/methylation domain-containing protein
VEAPPRPCYALAVRSTRHGFTLIEVILAVFLGLMVLMLAVPSISGVVNDNRLKASFEKFDELARRAQEQAVTERRAWLLVWEKEGILLRPEEPTEADEQKEPDLLYGDDETWQLQLPAALIKEPPAEWVFWPTGTCEPARIIHEGPAGSWTAYYEPLSGRPTLEKSGVR